MATARKIFGLLLCVLFSADFGFAKEEKGGALPFIGIEEERSLGDDIASFSIQYLKVIRNRTMEHFLTDLAQRIVGVSHWSGLNYTIFVINEKDINHFSLPGGNIYIFRGLLEACNSYHEVAAVLAHEIAHLAVRDGASRLAEKYGYSIAAQQLLGDNPEIASHIIRSLYGRDTLLDYPVDREYAADQTALEYLEKAGFDPGGLSRLLQHLTKLEKSDPQRLTLLRTTHPSAKKRLKKLKPANLSIPSDSGREASFQAVKQILNHLPY